MHRKLLHSLHALTVSLGLLTIGLIAANPDTIAKPIVASNSASSAVETMPLLGTGKETARTHNRHRRAQSRDAMVLPFFSFAQGLRRKARS